jgi:hypothetical protein
MLGITGNMLAFISSMLRHRLISVRVGNTLSKFCDINKGVPQGSSLSPTLFNIMTTDLPNKLTSGCKISLYADDICIWRRGKNINITNKHIQVDVNIFAQWCNDNNSVLSKNKTRCMVFTRKRNDTFNIEINGTTVERVSS